MGDENLSNLLPVERAAQGLDMLRQVRSRIDHRNLTFAKNVGARTMEREGARVVCDHATNARRQSVDGTVLELHFPPIGDVDGHGALLDSGKGRR